MRIQDFDFVETCSACPEQYDVYLGGNLVGYVRLRYGQLSAWCPTITGNPEHEVYTHQFEDEWLGEFHDDDERTEYLNECADAIMARMDRDHCCHIQEQYWGVKLCDEELPRIVKYETWKDAVSAIDLSDEFYKQLKESPDHKGIMDVMRETLLHFPSIVSWDFVNAIVWDEKTAIEVEKRNENA